MSAEARFARAVYRFAVGIGAREARRVDERRSIRDGEDREQAIIAAAEKVEKANEELWAALDHPPS